MRNTYTGRPSVPPPEWMEFLHSAEANTNFKPIQQSCNTMSVEEREAKQRARIEQRRRLREQRWREAQSAP